jgi:hypothetical protein
MDIKEHEDLEEKFQLSTNVSFSSDQDHFEGLGSLEIKIVKKKEEKQKIEEIELRNRKSKRTGLF